ncbi:MAG: glycosyltransferase [Bacilli bacterium]
MKVLVVSENFLNGGLERQIINQYNNLNSKVSFIYAFQKYEKSNCIKEWTIYKLEEGSSINSLINNCEKLIKIINKEKIDVIHVHPMLTLFPALFASQITKIPIAYTVHGLGSINAYRAINFKILFRYFLNNCNPLVITVDKNHDKVLAHNYLVNNIIYIPNSIDIKLFSDVKLVKNHKWMLLSRLDIDKKVEILKILELIKKAKIKIDIVGSGNCEQEIRQKVIDLKLQDKVKFLGYQSDIPNTMNNGYNGIIGIGQVVLEGLSANLPVLLMGYEKITGLMDANIFNQIKNVNFNNRFIKSNFKIEDLENINTNLETYQFNKSILNEFTGENVWNKYYNQLCQLEFYNCDQITNIYDDIKKLVEKNSTEKMKNFEDAITIYNIIRNNIYNYITDSNLIDLISFFDDKYYMESSIQIDMENIKKDNQKIVKDMNNIGLREVSKRTLKNIKNKISNS